MLKIKQITAILIVFIVVCSTSIFASAEVRAPSGIRGNGTGGITIDINSAPYTYYAGKSLGQYAYTPQGCAWFASARAYELTGKDTPIWNGSSWYNSVYSKYGYTRGSTIRAKALACYSGHVAVVEAVSGNSVIISEGGYGGSNPSSWGPNGYSRIISTTIDQVEAGTYEYMELGNILGYVYLDNSVTPTPNPQNPTTCSCSESYAGYYRVKWTDGVDVNSGHNYNSKLTAIPYDTIIYVSKASQPAGVKGGYAHVNYGGYDGIVATALLEPAPSYTFDLNGWLDGVYNGGLSDYCTVDVYIDDILVANDTGDFCREYPYGTKYEIKDIKATTGHVFQGYHIGGPSGTITGTTEVGLSLISDNQSPAISNLQITDISSEGYTVSCTVIDNIGVEKVWFPTWTAVEQDDLVWHEGVNPGNNVWNYRVNISDHLNDRGVYITQVYAWDKAGNLTTQEISVEVPQPKFYLDLSGWLDGAYNGNLESFGTADVYINGKLEANDCTDFYQAYPYGTTYEIKDIKAANGHVQLGNYTGNLGSIYDWRNGAPLSGTITDTTVVCPSFKTDNVKPTISNLTVTDVTADGYTISCMATDDNGISEVRFPTWTEKDGQDDLMKDWYTDEKCLGTKNGDTWTYRVNIADHDNESGNYITHIYAFDISGAHTEYGNIGNYQKEDVQVTVPVPTSGECGENAHWSFENGVLTISGSGSMTEYAHDRIIDGYHIPVYDVPPWNDYLNDITSIVIEDGITSVGGNAFNHCDNLEAVSLPDSLVSIGNRAFGYCGNLTQITLPSSLKKIDSWAFSQCGGLTELALPEHLEELGEYSFAYDTAIETVYFPISLKNVGTAAFSMCSSLTDVWYAGTKSDWDKIAFGNYNGNLTVYATIHFTSDSENTPIDPTVTIPGITNAGITVTAPEGGWKEGENTFSVACASPCVAMVSYDNGVTYQRISATVTDGGASYTVENLTADTILTVSLAGDANSDGKLTNADVTRLQAITLKKVQPTPLQAVLLDVNKDGKLTNADKTRLRAVQLKKTTLSW